MGWEYFHRFDDVCDKFLPMQGEGDTTATQICTAVNKIIYKWYNDGDVYDNTGNLRGWCNDLSSYANWLLKYAGCDRLCDISYCYTEDDYEELLKDLADEYLDESYLQEMNSKPKQGTIYSCEGPFQFIEYDEDEEY